MTTIKFLVYDRVYYFLWPNMAKVLYFRLNMQQDVDKWMLWKSSVSLLRCIYGRMLNN